MVVPLQFLKDLCTPQLKEAVLRVVKLVVV